MNLFDTLNEALTDEVVSKLAKLTDEDPAKTKKAIDGILCTLIAGLVRRTGSTMSVNMLYNQIQKGNQGGRLIGDVISYLNRKEDLDAILKVGDSQVSQIFPAYKSPLVSLIGIYAGIKKNSSSTYASLITPILIDAVSVEIANNKMDVDALTAYLAEHHEPLFKKAPEELMEKMIPQLGLQELLSPKFPLPKRVVTGKPTPQKSKAGAAPVDHQPVEAVEEEISEGSSFPIKGLLIFLVIVAAVAGGYYWYENYYKPSDTDTIQEETTVMEDSLSTGIDTTNTIAIDSLATKDSSAAQVAAPDATSTAGGSLSKEIDAYLADATKPAGQVFALKDIVFIKGSYALDDKSESSIKELVALFNKYPKLQIRIQGHSTDAVGVDNKTMAVKRAYAIKRKMLAAGVYDTRIDAIGITGQGDKTEVKIVAK